MQALFDIQKLLRYLQSHNENKHMGAYLRVSACPYHYGTYNYCLLRSLATNCQVSASVYHTTCFICKAKMNTPLKVLHK